MPEDDKKSLVGALKSCCGELDTFGKKRSIKSQCGFWNYGPHRISITIFYWEAAALVTPKIATTVDSGDPKKKICLMEQSRRKRVTISPTVVETIDLTKDSPEFSGRDTTTTTTNARISIG
jgi:hypothetical protein